MFAGFFAVVEQQLKKRTEDELVLGCFSCWAFIASVGCVWKSLGTCGEVCVSEKSVYPFLLHSSRIDFFFFWTE